MLEHRNINQAVGARDPDPADEFVDRLRRHAAPAEIRLYHPLFTRPDPGADGDLVADLNPHSLEILTGVVVEPGLAGDNSPAPVQFERQGYFVRDPDSAPGRLVFNRTIGLRDTWARAQAGGGGG